MYVCLACGYVYDPEKGDEAHGIAPGTAFEDLPYFRHRKRITGTYSTSVN